MGADRASAGWIDGPGRRAPRRGGSSIPCRGGAWWAGSGTLGRATGQATGSRAFNRHTEFAKGKAGSRQIAGALAKVQAQLQGFEGLEVKTVIVKDAPGGSDAGTLLMTGLTSAADKVPYFTGSGTAAVADFSSFGRSLVDDADGAAARTTLGLGSIATQSSSDVSITGGAISNVTIADVTIDCGTY